MSNDDAAPRLRIELTRFRARPYVTSLIDEWMAMLVARTDEALATFPRERMHLEVVFRDPGPDPEHVYWFSIQDEGGEPVETSDAPLDRDHLDYWGRCIADEPGEDLALAVAMIPYELRAVLRSTLGRAASGPA